MRGKLNFGPNLEPILFFINTFQMVSEYLNYLLFKKFPSLLRTPQAFPNHKLIITIHEMEQPGVAAKFISNWNAVLNGNWNFFSCSNARVLCEKFRINKNKYNYPITNENKIIIIIIIKIWKNCIFIPPVYMLNNMFVKIKTKAK